MKNFWLHLCGTLALCLFLGLDGLQAHGAGLPDARYIQNDFLQETGRFMPIVRVDLSAVAGSKFVYVPADQSY